MKIYRTVGEPEIWLVDKDGNKIAQCNPCTIECAVTTGLKRVINHGYY